MPTPKKYLDYEGLQYYHGKLKGIIKDYTIDNTLNIPGSLTITGTPLDGTTAATTDSVVIPTMVQADVTYTLLTTQPESFDPTAYYKLVNGTYVVGTSEDMWATDTWYSKTSSTNNGSRGLVPAPPSGTTASYFLDATGNWSQVSTTDTTYTLSGAYGTNNNTWITTLTDSNSEPAGTSTVPTATTSVYGITTLTDSYSSTSTTTAATPNAVKAAYDLANGKSTVSIANTITTGTNTKLADITINGNTTAINVSTMTGANGSNAGTAGLVPTPSATDNTKFLTGAGTWAVPTDTDTTYELSGATGANNTWTATLTPSTGAATTATVPSMAGATSNSAGTQGLVPAPAVTDIDKFLKGDGNWGTPTNTTYTLTQDSTDGHILTFTPSSGTATTITIPDNNTWTQMVGATSEANGTAGYVSAPPSDGYNTKFLGADGNWKVPEGTTYQEGTGIDITNNVISNTGVTAVTASTGTNGTISVTTNGTTAEVAVKGLGTAAYTDSSAYIQSFTYNGTQYSAVSTISIPVDTSITGGTTSTNAVQAQAIADFVNSSVSTNTAYFKGTYHSVNELPTTDVTNNDYAFVINLLVAELLTSQPSDWTTNYTNYYTKSGNNYIPIPKGTGAPTWAADTYYYASDSVFNRYKYNANLSTPGWEFEYSLNNSSFTASEWATIQSGLTSTSISDAIGLLDGSITGTAGTGKTLTALSQTDGVVSATFGDISITKSQVSDLGTIGAAAAYGVTDNSTATAVTGDDTNLITGRTLYNAGYTKNTGTVTGVTAGAGLTGGTISTSGTIALSLLSDTAVTGVAASTTTTTANRTYPVILDENSKLAVNVPWAGSSGTYAGASVDGGAANSAVKLETANSINGIPFDGSADINNYVVCDTAVGTAAKTVTKTGFELLEGSIINVMFTNGNTATNPTLAITYGTGQSTAAIPLYEGDATTRLTYSETVSSITYNHGTISAGAVYSFIYTNVNSSPKFIRINGDGYVTTTDIDGLFT